MNGQIESIPKMLFHSNLGIVPHVWPQIWLYKYSKNEKKIFWQKKIWKKSYNFSKCGSWTKASGWISLSGLPFNSICLKFGLFWSNPSGSWSISFSPISLKIKTISIQKCRKWYNFGPQLWISIHIGKSTIWKVYTYRYSNALKWEMPSGIDFRLFESRWSFLTFCKGLNELAWREDNLFEDNVLKNKKKVVSLRYFKVLWFHLQISQIL